MATFNSASNNVVNNSQLFQNLETNTGSSDALFRKARSSGGSLSTIVTGDDLGQLNFLGYDGSSYVAAGSMTYTAEGTIAAGQVPTKFTLSTANATGTPTLRLTINRIGISTFAAPSSGTSNIVVDAGDVSLTAGNINMADTNTAGSEGVINLGGDRFAHNRGNNNTFLGSLSGNFTLDAAAGNTCAGSNSGVSLDDGLNNTLIGYLAGSSITNGECTVLGSQALTALTTGTDVIAIGILAGSAYTSSESNNIVIDNTGVIAESNTIRIGTTQTRNFQAGITGITLSSPVGTVLVDASGQLGQGPAANVFKWVEVTGTSQAAAVGTGYIANNAALVTVTLPSTFAFGDVIEVGGKGAGQFTVAANTGDTISIVGPTAAGYTTSAGGSLAGQDQYGHLRLIAITANSAWIAIPTGNFLVT